MPVFGTIIRSLLDGKLTTIRELEEVTGRGSSTIYRWMNSESEPQHTDMRLLLRHMKSEEARRTLLSLLISDLPVVISWIDDLDDDGGASGAREGQREGHEVLDRSLLALDCLSDALSEGSEAIRKQELSRESYIKLVRLVDETIRHLTASRNLLNRYAPAGWIPGETGTPESG